MILSCGGGGHAPGTTSRNAAREGIEKRGEVIFTLKKHESCENYEIK